MHMHICLCSQSLQLPNNLLQRTVRSQPDDGRAHRGLQPVHVPGRGRSDHLGADPEVAQAREQHGGRADEQCAAPVRKTTSPKNGTVSATVAAATAVLTTRTRSRAGRPLAVDDAGPSASSTASGATTSAYLVSGLTSVV
jgi:hypothetical protein